MLTVAKGIEPIRDSEVPLLPLRVDLTDRKEVHGFVMWAMIGAQMLIEGVRGGDPGCCELSRILCSQMPQFTCPKPPGNGSLDSPAARLAGPHPESLRSEPG